MRNDRSTPINHGTGRSTQLTYNMERINTANIITTRYQRTLDKKKVDRIVANFDEEEFDWVKDLLYEVATTEVELNDTQRSIIENLIDLYWQNQPADDDGRYDFEI